MIKTQNTDGMELYIRVAADGGSLVNGHYSRSTALRQEWERIVAKRGTPKRHVYVFDGVDEFYDLGENDLAVGILDLANQNHPRYDIIVSHHPSAYLLDWGDCSRQLRLLGPEYLLLRAEYHQLQPSDRGYIAYVPGGNGDIFWRNIGDVSHSHPGIIVENYAPAESAKIIAHAGIVVCPASTVALEAMALGKRVLMTVTAEDQRPIVDGLEWLGYKDFVFTPELLHNRRKLKPIQLGNRWGAKQVAETIYKEANK